MEKSPVSRNPEVPFESSAYSISALARGKELRLTLSPLPGAQSKFSGEKAWVLWGFKGKPGLGGLAQNVGQSLSFLL